MKITIKKLKTMRSHDGGVACDCDVCLNGKTFAMAQDDGWGGGLFIQSTGTDHDSYQSNKEVLKKVEAYVKKTHNINLDEFVDNLIEAALNAKVEKKLENDYKKGICIGENKNKFEIMHWKGYRNLQLLADTPRGKEVIQKAITDIKKSGEKIINVDYLKSLGLKV